MVFFLEFKVVKKSLTYEASLIETLTIVLLMTGMSMDQVLLKLKSEKNSMFHSIKRQTLNNIVASMKKSTVRPIIDSVYLRSKSEEDNNFERSEISNGNIAKYDNCVYNIQPSEMSDNNQDDYKQDDYNREDYRDDYNRDCRPSNGFVNANGFNYDECLTIMTNDIDFNSVPGSAQSLNTNNNFNLIQNASDSNSLYLYCVSEVNNIDDNNINLNVSNSDDSNLNFNVSGANDGNIDDSNNSSIKEYFKFEKLIKKFSEYAYNNAHIRDDAMKFMEAKISSYEAIKNKNASSFEDHSFSKIPHSKKRKFHERGTERMNDKEINKTLAIKLISRKNDRMRSIKHPSSKNNHDLKGRRVDVWCVFLHFLNLFS